MYTLIITMLVDIIFLFFVCVILIIKLIKSFNHKVVDFRSDVNERKFVKPQEIIVEDIIIDQSVVNDEELKVIDQEKLLINLKKITINVWDAFSTGNTEQIFSKVNESILINIEKKIKLYSERSKLENITTFKIKKLYKNNQKILADVYLISEINDLSRIYKNVEEWSFSYKNDIQDWIVEYTSAF